MKTLQERAHACLHEWIEKNDEVCIRQMHFDEAGVQQVRYYPDTCEFIPRAEAIRRLEAMEEQI